MPRNSHIGRGGANSWKLRLTHRPWAGVRAELQAEEEKVAAREQEQRELEESLDVVRAELSRTEQARKDASIKVGSPAPHLTPPPGSEPSLGSCSDKFLSHFFLFCIHKNSQSNKNLANSFKVQ